MPFKQVSTPEWHMRMSIKLRIMCFHIAYFLRELCWLNKFPLQRQLPCILPTLHPDDIESVRLMPKKLYWMCEYCHLQKMYPWILDSWVAMLWRLQLNFIPIRHKRRHMHLVPNRLRQVQWQHLHKLLARLHKKIRRMHTRMRIDKLLRQSQPCSRIHYSSPCNYCICGMGRYRLCRSMVQSQNIRAVFCCFSHFCIGVHAHYWYYHSLK